MCATLAAVPAAATTVATVAVTVLAVVTLTTLARSSRSGSSSESLSLQRVDLPERHLDPLADAKTSSTSADATAAYELAHVRTRSGPSHGPGISCPSTAIR